MDITSATKHLIMSINSLSWVHGVKESEQDPGGKYTVYLLPAGVEVTRNMSQIKNRTYIFKLRLAASGGMATPTNIFRKMEELEGAIEKDPRRGGNAQTTYIGEAWEGLEDFKHGFAAFEVPVAVDIHS